MHFKSYIIFNILILQLRSTQAGLLMSSRNEIKSSMFLNLFLKYYTFGTINPVKKEKKN